ARRLAAAHAAAWGDSFLVREVARFAGWPVERRARRVRADSLRRVGVAAYGQEGAAAAIVVWRRAWSSAVGAGDTAGMAAILGNIGAGYSTEGDWDSAAAYLERARSLATSVGHLQVEANAVGILADLSLERGDLAAAREGQLRALALRRRIGDTRGVAAAHNQLGLLARDVGDLAEARRQFDTALASNRREGRDEVAATNLVNLAGLASLNGDFSRADRLYRDALATWRARGQWADAADALFGQGQLGLRRGDYPSARATLREALEIYNRTGPLDRTLATRRALAGALGAQGDVQGALDQLRRAQQVADSAGASAAERAGLSLARADLAVQLNMLADAERQYAVAEGQYRAVGDAAGEADAAEGLGLLAVERGDVARARTALENALRMHAGAGDRRRAAITRLSLARVALAGGDTAAARDQLATAVGELKGIGDSVALAAALGERAELERLAGLPAAAESYYGLALAALGDRVAPEVAWRLHAGRALVRRGLGAADEAARGLRAALAEIERPARSLALAERRSAFLSDKWDAYAQLARTEAARGRPGAAFEASERLRAREMLELLARGRVTAPADTAAELVAREQDLRRRIAELTRRLEGAGAGPEALRGPDVSLAAGPAHEALLAAQASYAELLLEIRERAPRHAALVSPAPADWHAVARRLAPDQALVEYLVSDSGSMAFVVTRDTVRLADLGTGRRELARLVEFVRGTLEPGGAGGALWRGPLRRLHDHLIAPLEEKGMLAGKRRLIFVPHGELHYLPFAALLDGGARGRFLVERYELAVTPSASVWLALGDRPARAGQGLLALAPRPDRLPASRREVAGLPALDGREPRVLTGRSATEDAFRREAGGRRVLHLATYGVLNQPNPLFSYVEFADGGEHDGRLEVHEVFGLDLAAELLVLSACQSGLGSGALADVPAGDDWVGLTRAFLHAGARHVVATLWPVEDEATAVLMERFYRELAAGAEPARALALAQRGLLAQRAAADPFHWAGFVAVEGSGRVEYGPGVGGRP
ncbi:MAG TPA: CHAT domain-containing protein, partial [Gemmatimonadales bacterium]|nr:CHAT domain-containing protein [Gemmatimonadales bacterium]